MIDSVYFVYGLLRPGGRYWAEVARFVEKYEPAMLKDHALLHLKDGFPAVDTSEGDVIFGDILFIKPGMEIEAKAVINDIKGVKESPPVFEIKDVYIRMLRTQERVLGITYVYGSKRGEYLRRHGELVSCGDWREFMNDMEEA